MDGKGNAHIRDSTTVDVNYAVQLHVKGSTDIIVNTVEKESKTHNLKISESQGTIVDKLQTNTNFVISTIRDEVRINSMENRKDTRQIIENQNAMAEVVNTFSDMHTEVTQAVLEQSQKQSDRADRSEHISYQLRGQLGVQGRKRRKEDLEEIARLRNEVGVLKRQNRDKDQAVKVLSAHVMSLEVKMKDMMTTHSESLVEQMREIRREKEDMRKDMRDMRREMSCQNTTLIDLVSTLVARLN